jgi:hypothetical protein
MKKFSFVALFIIVTISTSFGQTDSTFVPSGRITAQSFIDYFYKVHATEYYFGSAQYTGIKQDYASFDIRRLFLGYNYDFSPSFTGEILFSYEGNLDGSGDRGVLLKVADIKWKNVFPNADFVIGLQFTPSFVLLEEKVWAYRSIEKTILDKNKIAVPTDLGAGLQGAFDDGKNFGYDLLYADATGTKPENDRYKKLYADVWGKFLDQKIIIDLYGDINQTRDIPQIVYSTAKFFAAYQTPVLTIGVEAFLQYQTNSILASSDPNVVVSNFTDVKPFGISAFVRGAIIQNKLNFFARYDMFDPDLNFDNNLYYVTPGYSTAREHFVTLGLDWIPISNIHIMPNIWYNRYINKIQGATGTVLTDYDLVPRITFSFKY